MSGLRDHKIFCIANTYRDLVCETVGPRRVIPRTKLELMKSSKWKLFSQVFDICQTYKITPKDFLQAQFDFFQEADRSLYPQCNQLVGLNAIQRWQYWKDKQEQIKEELDSQEFNPVSIQKIIANIKAENPEMSDGEAHQLMEEYNLV